MNRMCRACCSRQRAAALFFEPLREQAADAATDERVGHASRIASSRMARSEPASAPGGHGTNRDTRRW